VRANLVIHAVWSFRLCLTVTLTPASHPHIIVLLAESAYVPLCLKGVPASKKKT